MTIICFRRGVQFLALYLACLSLCLFVCFSPCWDSKVCEPDVFVCAVRCICAHQEEGQEEATRAGCLRRVLLLECLPLYASPGNIYRRYLGLNQEGRNRLVVGSTGEDIPILLNKEKLPVVAVCRMPPVFHDHAVSYNRKGLSSTVVAIKWKMHSRVEVLDIFSLCLSLNTSLLPPLRH